MQKYCNCHNVLTAKESFEGTVDEIKEFIEDPSMDELSDIVYFLN